MMMLAFLSGLETPAGSTDYKQRFLDTITDPDVKAALKEGIANKQWQIHHTYQQDQAVQDFLRSMKGADFDVHNPNNAAAVPTNVHKRISAEQTKFWRDQWNAIPEAQKRAGLGLNAGQRIPPWSIGNTIAATADREALLAKMEDMIKAQDKYFSPFWLSKGATAADVTRLARELGINLPNAKVAQVMEKITSKSMIEKFRDLYQPRMNQIWEAIKGGGGVIQKLKDSAKFAAKMVMWAMIIDMIGSDLALAGDPNAQLWQEAHQNFQNAVNNQERLGYPVVTDVEKAKESLMAALNGFKSGGDAAAILRYILEVELELEISKLR